MQRWPLGVFASVDAGLGVRLDVAQELGIPTVQLHAPHPGRRGADDAKAFAEKAAAAGVTVTCVFGGFEGESYADIPTTARTVGLVPAATRAARLAEMKEIAAFARHLGCDAVGLHVGFVPEPGADYDDLLVTVRDLLDELAGFGQRLHLETGQETAERLLRFIADTGRDNLFINFDPANMILYGTGEPIAALKQVGHLVKSVHCKDAAWAADGERGKSWGREVPLGEGDVGMLTYLQTLADLGYEGPLTIEREIPQDPDRQRTDVGRAVALLTQLQQQVVG